MSGREILAAILRKPFARATWRDVLYLCLGAATAAIAFAVVLAAGIVGGVMLLTILGLPVLLACFWLVRVAAHGDRRRAAIVLGAPIEARYRRPPPGGRVLSRLETAATDRQTWKDLLWLILSAPLCFAAAVAIVSAWGAAVYWLSIPIWWWAIPNDWDSGPWPLESWLAAVGAAALGLATLLLVPWVARLLALVEVSLARGLLGPGKQAQLEERVTELAETRAGALSGQSAELQRIERDLHDGAQARLVALAMDLGLAREKLEADPDGARALVDSAHQEAKIALKELRELVRGVHPSILTDRGLDPALSALAARSPVPVSLSVELPSRLDPTVESAAYFVVNEALANVAKHSRASSCRVEVARTNGALRIVVADDGGGGADPENGSGLSGLQRRVRALDGRLALESPAGGGTVLRVEIPCES